MYARSIRCYSLRPVCPTTGEHYAGGSPQDNGHRAHGVHTHEGRFTWYMYGHYHSCARCLRFRAAMRIRPQLERLNRHGARRAHAMRSSHDLVVDSGVSDPVHDKQVCREAQIQAMTPIVTKHQQKRVKRVSLGRHSPQNWCSSRVFQSCIMVNDASLFPRHLLARTRGIAPASAQAQLTSELRNVKCRLRPFTGHPQ